MMKETSSRMQVLVKELRPSQAWRCSSVILALRRQKWEEQKVKVRMSYIMR
jgi:hypothetical protein